MTATVCKSDTKGVQEMLEETICLEGIDIEKSVKPAFQLKTVDATH